MRAIFAGGGTGGHIYMAVALAEALRGRSPDHQFLFIGTERGLEARILEPLGYAWETIRIGGLNRVGAGRMLRTLGQLPSSWLASRRILRRFRPHAVVGLGGYSSGPVAAAARLARIPILLLEPNVLPGLTNRLLMRWASAAAVAFQETADMLGARARLTGIPVRRAFHELPPAPVHEERLGLLIFGGSQGSRPLNRLLCQALPLLKGLPLDIRHQTGPNDLDEVQAAYRRQGVEAQVTAYIDDMPQAFARSALLLCRAGASTVAEIAASGRPSLLVPLPTAADDHQRKNAAALARRGAAVVLDQKETDAQKLAAHIGQLGEDRPRLAAMGESARALAQPQAADNIISLLAELLGQAAGEGPGINKEDAVKLPKRP
ncbi:MAG TPA: undecaprenyldiphospho-muramoylpentapeptide beta-N-acetylglucosaminyltransferase [Acidobacteriota bacterium]|nr:undecaprenyldiphospho-muramoylpentapeptide beta-N-acetylglucosaminyltransferase [Acidobacteriota bacterium]